MERKSSCQMLIQAVRAGRRNVFTRRLPPPFYHVISCLRTFMSPRSLIAAAAAVVVSLRHDSDGSNSDCVRRRREKGGLLCCSRAVSPFLEICGVVAVF